MSTPYTGDASNITPGTVPGVTLAVDGEPRTAASVDGPLQTNTDWARFLLESICGAQVSAFRPVVVPQAGGQNQDVNGGCWDPKIGFVIVTDNLGIAPGSVMIAPDAEGWSPQFVPTIGGVTQPLFCAASDGNGTVCIAGKRGIFSSGLNDGTTWTNRLSLAAGNEFYAIVWDGTKFIACGTNTAGDGLVYTSPTGVTWTNQTFGGVLSGYIQYAAAGNGMILALPGTGHVWKSTDHGSTWTDTGLISGIVGPKLTFARGLFVITVSSGSATVKTSPDGVTWTLRTLPSGPDGTPANSINALCGDANQLLLVASFAAQGQPCLMNSLDGVTWRRCGVPYMPSATPVVPTKVFGGGGKFIAGYPAVVSVVAVTPGLILP